MQSASNFMYSWPKMKNLKRSFPAKVRKVEISPMLIRGSFKRFEDSEYTPKNFSDLNPTQKNSPIELKKSQNYP